jgi:hypothetical protein
MMDFALLTSPFGGEVAPLGAGEGAFPPHRAKTRAPHPALRADLSPRGRGDVSPTAAKQAKDH